MLRLRCSICRRITTQNHPNKLLKPKLQSHKMDLLGLLQWPVAVGCGNPYQMGRCCPAYLYCQALQLLTGPEKRATEDWVLSFIVRSYASPRACLTAFLTSLFERLNLNYMPSSTRGRNRSDSSLPHGGACTGHTEPCSCSMSVKHHATRRHESVSCRRVA